MIYYEIWDAASGNLLGSYRDEDDALALVRRIIAAEPSSAKDLVLEWGDDEDEGAGGLLAEADRLAELAAPGGTRPRRILRPAES